MDLNIHSLPRISELPQDVSQKICTGLVILDLAGACKELIDNALDANSTNIEVRTVENGTELIEVIDNGSGILPDDFDKICKPHCTSKLTGFESFDSLNTFGFRGEALNALTNTSQVQITTRDVNSRCAFRLVFDRNGEILERQQCSRQARKPSQLLTSPGGNTQLIDVITNLLGTPKNELLELSESIPEEDIQQIYKINNSDCEDIFKQMRLSGYISNFEYGRCKIVKEKHFVYVNGRHIESQRLSKIANDLYGQYNKCGQRCILILFISIPSSTLDVNVTPDKKTLFLHFEKELFAKLHSTLIFTFSKVQAKSQRLFYDFKSSANLLNNLKKLERTDSGGSPNVVQIENDDDFCKSDFKRMHLIGQFNNAFILTRFGPHLFMIDQHAADEKHNFEMLQLTTTIKSQKLFKAQLLNFGPMDFALLRDNLDLFNKNGFEFVFDDDDCEEEDVQNDGDITTTINTTQNSSARLVALPNIVGHSFDKHDIDEILSMIAEMPGQLHRPRKVRSIFASKACRKSVIRTSNRMSVAESEGVPAAKPASDEEAKRQALAAKKAEVRKRLEEAGKKGKKKKGFLTPERKKKLRKLLMIKAAENLKNQQKQLDSERQSVLSKRISACPDVDKIDDVGQLSKIYNDLFQKMLQLEEEKYDINFAVSQKDSEINEMTINVNDLRGKFVKPTLKKVSKYDNKFRKVLAGEGEATSTKPKEDFRAKLKAVEKKNVMEVLENKQKSKAEKPEWSKKGDEKGAGRRASAASSGGGAPPSPKKLTAGQAAPPPEEEEEEIIEDEGEGEEEEE
uniref:Uncharacterized protein n=2 Tax=Meloidogyne TaxID=189290 RepID=A0A915MDG0_MELJA